MSNMSKYDLSSIEIEFAPNFDETPTTELQYSDLEHQRLVDTPEQHMEKLGMQAISIRLQKKLVDDFKVLAELNGIGYQTLMKQVFNRFIQSEMKRIANQHMFEMKSELDKLKQAEKQKIEEEKSILKQA